MAISLFKPNVRRMKEKRDVKGLIKALNYRKGTRVPREAAIALGDIGDERAVGPLIYALKHASYEYDAGGYRGRVCTVWHDEVRRALIKIGEPAVDPLLQALCRETDTDIQKHMAWALTEIGLDHKAEETLIKYFLEGQLTPSLFKAWFVEHFAHNNDYKAAYAVLQAIFTVPTERGNLQRLLGEEYFGDYNSIIVRAASYIKIDRTKWDLERFTGPIDYDISGCIDAINDLANITSRTAENLLHEISRINDVEVVVAIGCLDNTYGKLDFSKVRNAAKDKLKRRGDPPYDPAIYLEEEAWKL